MTDECELLDRVLKCWQATVRDVFGRELIVFNFREPRFIGRHFILSDEDSMQPDEPIYVQAAKEL